MKRVPPVHQGVITMLTMLTILTNHSLAALVSTHVKTDIFKKWLSDKGPTPEPGEAIMIYFFSEYMYCNLNLAQLTTE